MEIFKTLIMAVVAAAILSVLANTLGIFYFGQSEFDAIQKQLKTAEAVQGKIIFGEIESRKGTGFSAASFETSRRIMAFECNNASLCCPEGEKCEGKIEWNMEKVLFKEQKKILAATRCETTAEKLSCKTYFGDIPAQLEIIKAEARQEFDLRKETPTIEATILNNGTKPAFFTTITARVFERIIEEGQERKTLLEGKKTEHSLGKIEAGKTATASIPITSLGAGKFEIELTVKEQNSGHDTKLVSFNTFKSLGECTADGKKQKDIFWITSNECGQKYYCQNCEFGHECVQVWQQETGETMEVGNSEFAYKNIECPSIIEDQ